MASQQQQQRQRQRWNHMHKLLGEHLGGSQYRRFQEVRQSDFTKTAEQNVQLQVLHGLLLRC